VANEAESAVRVRVEGDAILGEVEIAAPPERVFRALTDPERLRTWWGSRETYWVEEWRADLRVGGAWEARCMSAGGKPSRVHGVFVEIDPPRRLAYTWNPSWHEAPQTTVVYDLAPSGSGTRVYVRHTGFGAARAARDDHRRGWPAVLTWLRAHVERGDDAPPHTKQRVRGR
jgi:uncharacterized protein YndB with AHSA1/START domain